VVTTVFTASGRIATPSTFTDGLRPALAVAAVLSLVGAFAAVAVQRRPSHYSGEVVPKTKFLATTSPE
jgi:hypothetical protein